MNEGAVLALLGDLYAQIIVLQKENAELKQAQQQQAREETNS